jgi:hypothetical protein
MIFSPINPLAHNGAAGPPHEIVPPVVVNIFAEAPMADLSNA